MSKSILLIIFLQGTSFAYAQNIGIGTNSPKAKLHVADSSVLFTGNLALPSIPGNPPWTGAGTRMMWYPDKAAFRAGAVDGEHWDRIYIGNYSFAAGFSTAAEGISSVSMGYHCEAGGDESVTIGRNCVAFGDQAVAMGLGCQANGPTSVSMGFSNSANGNHALALGYDSDASGNNSIAIGSDAEATADNAIAIGNLVTASGDFSIALGSYVSTSGFEGSLTIGDHSTTTVMGTFVANGFRSRFAGGYRLFTNSAANVGAFLNANANSWATLSDVRVKENFLPVDGESFLRKIAAMPQFTWNYIGQDVKTLRHYGPMAQDFYAAFGNDALGVIGCDTLINQQDFLGVNLIAIQALEKRTATLQQQLEEAMNLLKTNQHTIVLLEEQNKLLRQLVDKKKN